jgi:hypothetical protein
VADENVARLNDGGLGLAMAWCGQLSVCLGLASGLPHHCTINLLILHRYHWRAIGVGYNVGVRQVVVAAGFGDVYQ